MSDEAHRTSINTELARHELEALAEAYKKAGDLLDEHKGDHTPPALQAVMGLILDDGMKYRVPPKQILLTAFLVGIEEGKAGKSFEDYTRCKC